MYTKNAFKNLKNRYKAVLKKCTLLNIFGSLALATAFLMSSVCMSVVPHSACASVIQETDAYRIEEYVSGTNYYNTFEVEKADANGTITTTQYGILLITPTNTTTHTTGTASTMKDLLTAYIETESSTATGKPYDSIKVENSGDFSFVYTDESGTPQELKFNVLDSSNTIIANMSTSDRETNPNTNLNSNFIGIESTTANGGAINNTSNGTSIDITGDFIGNSTSYLFEMSILGGAIYNSGKIGDIKGSFIGNYASGSATWGVNGGAIYNLNGTIESISGNFIGNYASNSDGGANGGAIYNINGTISDIQGSFIGNYASVISENSNVSAHGGAIYNSGTITSITGSFIGNYVSSTKGGAYGGAVYIDLCRSSISGSFIGNYASSTNGTAYGGAIYNHKGIFITFLANNQTHLFTDNYTLNNGDKDYNFIYNEDGGEITFTMQGTGGFILNDSIKGNTNIINITGENKDKNIFSLNDEISGFSTFNVTNATLSLGSYNHGDSTTVASFTNSDSSISTMSFTNANLSIDTLAFTGITDGTAALDGTNIKLTANASSTLILENASVGKTYTIAKNFESVSGFFTEDTTTVANALLEVTSTSGDAITEAFTVTVVVKPLPDTGTDTENFIYNTPSAGLINAIASAGAEIYSSTSTNAGGRFVYNIMTNLDTSISQKIQIVEGAVQMGAVAGVQKGLASTISSANTVLDTRMLNANSINPSSTAMRVVDENGHVSVYNNISTIASNSNGVLSSPKNYTEIWLMPMYAHEKISGVSSGNFSNTGYKSDMYGVALGIDRTYQDKYRFGLAFDMGSGSSESNGDYATTENDYDFFGFTAYGSVRFDNLSILGSVGYTKNDSEVAQNLSAYGLNNLYSDIKSDVWNFNLKAEYNYAFGQGYNLTPYLGVQYMIMSTDDYKVKEANSTGNGAYGNTVFNINSDKQDVFSFPLGVALSKEIHTENGWDFTPKVNAGVIFATGDLYATSVSSIPEIDGSSSMSLKVIDSATLDLGLGLSASKNNFTMMLDYDFQHSEHRTAHGVMAKVLFKF